MSKFLAAAIRQPFKSCASLKGQFFRRTFAFSTTPPLSVPLQQPHTADASYAHHSQQSWENNRYPRDPLNDVRNEDEMADEMQAGWDSIREDVNFTAAAEGAPNREEYKKDTNKQQRGEPIRLSFA
eukprot:GEZU01006825.1.p1 GENE.GEZU01006825.1~~GEZU01006825.1.p1  ORF type:complete len:145 (+),score=18.60 GEZU01006825.1:59-436(+)